jgi:hypothetical protein
MKKVFFEKVFEITDERGATEQCRVKIGAAELMSDSNFGCEVEVTPMLKSMKVILGVDADQATSLAIQFVKSLLSGRRLTDVSGAHLELAKATDRVF